jgi:hypothetical protein
MVENGIILGNKGHNHEHSRTEKTALSNGTVTDPIPLGLVLIFNFFSDPDLDDEFMSANAVRIQWKPGATHFKCIIVRFFGHLFACLLVLIR